LVERGVIAPQDRVIVISTAHGLKFTDFKVRYHEGTLPGVEALRRNPPLELPADAGAVREAIARGLDRRQRPTHHA
ncbi:MAG: threonine synthase, partial [Chloroflexi bacterium]|nr:threonine synthase [Chloroflexota bacterium]